MNISQATKRMTIVLGLLQKSPVFAVGVFAWFFCAVITGRRREEDQENQPPDDVGGH